MLQRTTVIAAAGAIAAVAAVTADDPVTSRARSAPPTGTLELVEREGPARFIDNPPRGGRRRPPSVGDQLLTTGVDFDATGQTRLGRSYLTCTFAGASLLNCRGTVVLRDGQITVQGVARDEPATTIAVTGGTGRYAGARGTMAVRDEGARERATLTFLP
jgi:allene oxide cyclase